MKQPFKLGPSLRRAVQQPGIPLTLARSGLIQSVAKVSCQLTVRQLAQTLIQQTEIKGLLLALPEDLEADPPVGILMPSELGLWRCDPSLWRQYADLPLREAKPLWDPCQRVLVLSGQVSVRSAAQAWLEAADQGIAASLSGGWGLVDPVALVTTAWQQQAPAEDPDSSVADLRRQNEMILNSAGEGIYGLDLGGKVTFANPAAARMIGWSVEELIGQSMHDLMHHSHADRSPYPRVGCPIYLAFQDGQIHSVIDEVFWRKDGSCFSVEYTSTPMRDEQGHLVGAVVTFQDITERKWAEQVLRQYQEQLEQKVLERTAELQQANQQLQALSDLKSRFVSMVCHEFRTPLNTILFAVTSLERYRQQLSAPDQSRYIQGIQADIRHMTQMLDDVLLLGKADAHKVDPHWTDLDCVYFCRALIEDMQLTHPQPQIQFFSNCLHQTIVSDPAMIRSIVINLVSNAMKYSQPHQSVQVELKATPNRIQLIVKDQGIGIPDEDLPYLFEAFHRGRNVGTIPGTGLGLTIIKRLIDVLKGSIEVDSEVGSGTTFRVEIPNQCKRSSA